MQGLRSRTLANRVSEYAGPLGWSTADELRDGLRKLGPESWAVIFTPTLSELRDLIEFARDRDVQLLGRLLAGETVSIPVELATSAPPGHLELVVADVPSLFGGITIRAGGVPSAVVPTKYQSELMAVLELGWPCALALDLSEADEPVLRITLAL